MASSSFKPDKAQVLRELRQFRTMMGERAPMLDKTKREAMTRGLGYVYLSYVPENDEDDRQMATLFQATLTEFTMRTTMIDHFPPKWSAK